MLVVQRNRLVGGIFGRGVDATAYQGSRCRSVRVIQELTGNCFNQLFELFWRFQIKTAKKYAALLPQTRREEFAVTAGPVNQLDSGRCRRDDERKAPRPEVVCSD